MAGLAANPPPLAPVAYAVGARGFQGFIADGSGGRKAPGVLVAHEGPGLNAHIKERTQRIAALGYVAFAIDLYGVADPPIEEARGYVTMLRNDLDELRGRMVAALNVLTSRENVDAARIAGVGFCFGGNAVLELARSGAEIAGAIGFHAGLDTLRPDDARNIKAPVLVCLGADDPIVTEEKRRLFSEEMTKGGVDWRMELYGGVGHSFTNPGIDAWKFPGFSYSASADHRSWATMRAFLDEVFA